MVDGKNLLPYLEVLYLGFFFAKIIFSWFVLRGGGGKATIYIKLMSKLIGYYSLSMCVHQPIPWLYSSTDGCRSFWLPDTCDATGFIEDGWPCVAGLTVGWYRTGPCGVSGILIDSGSANGSFAVRWPLTGLSTTSRSSPYSIRSLSWLRTSMHISRLLGFWNCMTGLLIWGLKITIFPAGFGMLFE